MSTIVITGCSTGFGFQAAKMFAARGDKVFATMRNVAGKNIN
jgi:NAD(P)-dependent dehydrogenase (short-subunit alcohol dehydrogenase family)